MSKTSIEIGVVKGRETGLHDARPLVSVEVSPGSVSTVVTSADQADQGYDMGTLRVANGSAPIFISVGLDPDCSVHPRRFIASWDTFGGIIKAGHRARLRKAAMAPECSHCQRSTQIAPPFYLQRIIVVSK